MLTLDALRGALKRVSYWPGWRFVLYQHAEEGIWLSIKAELPDADHPTRTKIVSIRATVPPMPHETYFFSWLDWRLQRVNSGQHREAFRVDGKQWADPHAPHADE